MMLIFDSCTRALSFDGVPFVRMPDLVLHTHESLCQTFELFVFGRSPRVDRARSQRRVARGQKVDGRSQRVDRRSWTVDGRSWAVNGGSWMVDRGSWTVDGGSVLFGLLLSERQSFS